MDRIARQCRARKVGKISGDVTRCTLSLGHRGAVHFHDGIETFVWWRRRGERGIPWSRSKNGKQAFAINGAGATSHAHIWALRLVIKSRQLRMAKSAVRRG